MSEPAYSSLRSFHWSLLTVVGFCGGPGLGILELHLIVFCSCFILEFTIT